MTDREAMQKALDTPYRRYSIKPHGNGYAIYRDRDLFHHGFNLGHLTEVTPETIKLIEDAMNAMLAQPEQKPVAYLYHDTACAELANPLADSTLLVLACDRKPNGRNETPLYTAPPSKPWVSLTDEEIYYIWSISPGDWEDKFAFPRAIEAKLKEKNT